MCGTVVDHAVASSFLGRIVLTSFSLTSHLLNEYTQMWHVTQSASYLHNISQPRVSFTTFTEWRTPPRPFGLVPSLVGN